jgi:hypothetical protein
VIGDPSIFKEIRKTVDLARVLSTFTFRVAENVGVTEVEYERLKTKTEESTRLTTGRGKGNV